MDPSIYNGTNGDGDDVGNYIGRIKVVAGQDLILGESVAGDVYIDRGTVNCGRISSSGTNQTTSKIRGGTFNTTGIDPGVVVEGTPTINIIGGTAPSDPWATIIDPAKYAPGTAGWLLLNPPTKLVRE
jgi:hypothetical protein